VRPSRRAQNCIPGRRWDYFEVYPRLLPCASGFDQSILVTAVYSRASALGMGPRRRTRQGSWRRLFSSAFGAQNPRHHQRVSVVQRGRTHVHEALSVHHRCPAVKGDRKESNTLDARPSLHSPPNACSLPAAHCLPNPTRRIRESASLASSASPRARGEVPRPSARFVREGERCDYRDCPSAAIRSASPPHLSPTSFLRACGNCPPRRRSNGILPPAALLTATVVIPLDDAGLRQRDADCGGN
jgi:hypothetical protein